MDCRLSTGLVWINCGLVWTRRESGIILDLTQSLCSFGLRLRLCGLRFNLDSMAKLRCSGLDLCSVPRDSLILKDAVASVNI